MSRCIPGHPFVTGAAPTANDDSAHGCNAGMIWVDTAGAAVYECTDDTPTAAVWKNLSTTVGGIASAPASAPSDGSLAINQVAFWLDAAGHKLMFKCKYANGTIESGSAALT